MATHLEGSHRASLGQARRGLGATCRPPTTSASPRPPKVCGMGHRMKRKEDPRFIQGKGRYVDDIKLPGHGVHGHRAQPVRARQDPQDRRQRGAGDARRARRDHRRGSEEGRQSALDADADVGHPDGAADREGGVLRAGSLRGDRHRALHRRRRDREGRGRLRAARGRSIDPLKALEDKIIVRDDKEKKTNHIWHWEAGDKAATDAVFASAAHRRQAERSTCRASTCRRSRPAAWSRTTTRRAATCRST